MSQKSSYHTDEFALERVSVRAAVPVFPSSHAVLYTSSNTHNLHVQPSCHLSHVHTHTHTEMGDRLINFANNTKLI